MSDWGACLRKGCDLQIHTGNQLTLAQWWELCSSFDSRSSKPVKLPMPSMVRVCLMLCCFLHTQGRKPQLFSLLQKQLVGSAPLCQLWSGLYKEKVMAEMGTNQGPCIPGKPSKSLQQNPARDSCPSCGRAQQLSAQLLWLAREHNSQGGDGGKEFFCCVTQMSSERGLAQSRDSHIQCSFLQPDYGGWEWGIRAFRAQTKSHAFQVSSGGGSFSLSFLKMFSLQGRTLSEISQGLWSQG